jgi:hypothetical protein
VATGSVSCFRVVQKGEVAPASFAHPLKNSRMRETETIMSERADYDAKSDSAMSCPGAMEVFLILILPPHSWHL